MKSAKISAIALAVAAAGMASTSFARADEAQDKMTMFRRIGVLLLAVFIWCVCLELGEQFAIPGLPGFMSTAEAVVGRPLTPMSAAGVARRTSRRCAARGYC